METERERWDLSAPASQVLLTGAATPNKWAITLALKELVLRRALTLQRERRRRLFLLRRDVDTLAVNRWPAMEAGRSLLGVMEAFPKAAIFRSDQGGVPIDIAAKEVGRWYRAGGGYVQAEVLPELQRRGFYRIYQTDKGPEWQLTETGMEKLTELRASMETGRTELPGWLRDDRKKAAAYITGAGAMLLLLGNPVTWLWDLLADALAGGTVTADGIPAGAVFPFVLPPERPPSERDSGREYPYHGDQGDATQPSSGETGETPDGAPAGGGGGGFDSPGEAIDAGMAGDGDGDGGGDGE